MAGEATTTGTSAPIEGADLLRYPQAAALLGVPVGTVYAWVHQRRIPHHRMGPRLVLFSRGALNEWLRRHAVAAD